MIERPLDLDAVQAFLHIAELGSFTRAADAMRTTQSAVSLKLKRLEERLGFRRKGRRSSIAPATCWRRISARSRSLPARVSA